jgi:hypothetical protein|tara:strand:+ start:69 stop:302 length:234 start_codon:yes stop_codon:yes gene_type:complete
MAKKEKWEIERDKENKLKADAMKSLTKDQLDAINLAHKAIEDALLNIREIEDLYLSDIKNLDIAFWRLRNQFNLGDN